MGVHAPASSIYKDVQCNLAASGFHLRYARLRTVRLGSSSGAHYPPTALYSVQVV